MPSFLFSDSQRPPPCCCLLRLIHLGGSTIGPPPYRHPQPPSPSKSTKLYSACRAEKQVLDLVVSFLPSYPATNWGPSAKVEAVLESKTPIQSTNLRCLCYNDPIHSRPMVSHTLDLEGHSRLRSSFQWNLLLRTSNYNRGTHTLLCLGEAS